MEGAHTVFDENSFTLGREAEIMMTEFEIICRQSSNPSSSCRTTTTTLLALDSLLPEVKKKSAKIQGCGVHPRMHAWRISSEKAGMR